MPAEDTAGPEGGHAGSPVSVSPGRQARASTMVEGLPVNKCRCRGVDRPAHRMPARPTLFEGLLTAGSRSPGTGSLGGRQASRVESRTSTTGRWLRASHRGRPQPQASLTRSSCYYQLSTDSAARHPARPYLRREPPRRRAGQRRDPGRQSGQLGISGAVSADDGLGAGRILHGANQRRSTPSSGRSRPTFTAVHRHPVQCRRAEVVLSPRPARFALRALC